MDTEFGSAELGLPAHVATELDTIARLQLSVMRCETESVQASGETSTMNCREELLMGIVDVLEYKSSI